jgi:D-tyrosyl-tRNA(Tyr) deacylase
MRIVLQRVLSARIEVDGAVTGEIGPGLLILLGVKKGDQVQDAAYLAAKTLGLRVFPDAAGKMNLSVAETGGGILVASQFTLYGDCRKGRRPGFDESAPAEAARELYESYLAQLRLSGLRVETGVFQADMKVSLVNDGPVTLIVDS